MKERLHEAVCEIYQTLGMVGRIEELTDSKLHRSDADQTDSAANSQRVPQCLYDQLLLHPQYAAATGGEYADLAAVHSAFSHAP